MTTLDIPAADDWRLSADCRHWRGFDDQDHDTREAVCTGCPVRPECWAADPDPTYGAKDERVRALALNQSGPGRWARDEGWAAFVPAAELLAALDEEPQP